MSELIFPDVKISEAEFCCPCCGKLPPDLMDNQFYYYCFRMWQDLRDEWNKPIIISKGGGWRCPRYQYRLIVDGKTKATVSPHSFWALDNDFDGRVEVVQFVELVEEKHPELRVGYLGYLDKGQSFVHLDRCYLISPRASETWTKAFRW